MIQIIKRNFPNIYIIIVAVAIAIWFDGINSILRSFIPQTAFNGALLCTISLTILYLDDYRLGELYNYNPEQDKLTRHGAAAMASARYD